MPKNFANNIKLLESQSEKLRNQGVYFQAIVIFKKLLPIYQKTNNKIGVGHCLFQIGLCYRMADQLKPAAKSLEKAINFFTKEKIDDKLANAYREIGIIYYHMHEYKIAKKWLTKSLELSKNLPQKSDYAMVLARLGQVEMSLKKFDNADKLISKAITIVNKTDNWFFTALIYYFMGRLNCHRKNYQKAIDYLEQAETILDSHKQAKIHIRTYSLIWSTLANCHIKLGNLEIAHDYYIRSLEQVFAMPDQMAATLLRANDMQEFIDELIKYKE